MSKQNKKLSEKDLESLLLESDSDDNDLFHGDNEADPGGSGDSSIVPMIYILKIVWEEE